MKHWPAILICALSALLFLGVTVTWAANLLIGRRETLMYYGPARCYVVNADTQRLTVALTHYRANPPSLGAVAGGWRTVVEESSPGKVYVWSSSRYGFSHGRYDDQGYGGDTRFASARYVWLLAATAVTPACYVIARVRRARRRAAGMCRRCGYDLRASTERCPECGEPILAPRVTPLATPAAPPLSPPASTG
jgi:hypothetical protein